MVESKLLRRFLAYWWALMRHTTALLLAFVSGGIVSAIPWVRPLLPRQYGLFVDALGNTIGESYGYFALACVAIGFFVASFLAWNEERDEIENLASRIHESKPILTSHSVG